VKKFIFLLSVVFLFATEYKEGYEDFSLINPSNTQNIYGNFVVIGNTVAGVTKCKALCDGYDYDKYCELDKDDNKKYFNNKYIVRYFIKSDSDNNEDLNHGSVSYLKLPSNAKKILWAAIYWQGHVNNYSYVSSNTPDRKDGYDKYYSNNIDRKFFLEYIPSDTLCNTGAEYYYNLSNDLPDNDPDKIKETDANKLTLEIEGQSYAIEADKLYYADDSRYFCKVDECSENDTKNTDTINEKFLKKRGVKYAAYTVLNESIIDTLNQYLQKAKDDGIKIKISDLLMTQGLDFRLGNYGAWSLVVIYSENLSDENTKLRSVNIYTGFKNLSDKNHDLGLNISHLILPHSGTVDSKMSVFSVEGEKSQVGDYVQINDMNLTENIEDFDPNNEFDSYLSDEIKRDPKVSNNNGIDIDIFDASDVLTVIRDNEDAQEYSVTLNVHTQTDGIFLEMIGFSTQLYQPRVCYYIDKIQSGDEVVYENGSFVDGAKIDPEKEYEITFWIANMKKNKNDGDIEKAENVKVFMDMESFEYTADSTFVKNAPNGDSEFKHVTDSSGDDVFMYDFDKNQSVYNVGKNATSNSGGELDVASSFDDSENKYYSNFRGFFVTENKDKIDLDEVFKFKASFETEWMKIEEDNAQEIPKCIPFDTKGDVYIPPPGSFNVVETTFDSQIDPVESELNDIYTKIVAKPFDMKVIKLDENNKLQKYKGVIRVDVIKDVQSEEECKENGAVWSGYVLFNNKTNVIISDINISKAMKKARFRVKYLVDKNGNLLKGAHVSCLAHTYNCIWGLLTQIATDRYGNTCPTGRSFVNDSNYCDIPCAQECNYYRNRAQNQGEDNTVPSQECIKCVFDNYTNSACSRDNFAVRPYKFNIKELNINKLISGEEYQYEIEALDYDLNPAKDYNETLTIKKATISSNANLVLEYNETKNGCVLGDLLPQTTLTFVNGRTSYTAKYTEVGKVKFLIKELGDIYASVDLDDINTQNSKITSTQKEFEFIPYEFMFVNVSYLNGYNGFTYLSNDLTMSSKLGFDIKAINKNSNVVKNYSSECYAKNVEVKITHSLSSGINNKLIYQEHQSDTVNIKQNTQDIKVSLDKSRFSQGEASSIIKINFKKDYKTPQEPFTFTLNTLSVKNSDNVSGNYDLDSGVTFYYGRIKIPNISGYASVLYNNIEYQYFKNNKWIVNTLHTSTQAGGINIANSVVPGVDMQLNPIDNGTQIIKYIAQYPPPYKTRGDYAISSWMWYHPKATVYLPPSVTNKNCLTHPCNKISFLKVGEGWGGVGDQDSIYAPSNKAAKVKSKADTQTPGISKSSVKKLNW